MLKELFESSFYITYPRVPEKVLLLKERICSGDFFLTDANACRDYVREDVGMSCDYMLEDSNMTALVELTCSKAEYVVDKRQTARRQLFNSLCILYSNPIIKKHIEDHAFRYVVFAWKDSLWNLQEHDGVEDSMMGMTMMPDLVYSADNESKFDFDFKLKEIRYPHPFVCK